MKSPGRPTSTGKTGVDGGSVRGVGRRAPVRFAAALGSGCTGGRFPGVKSAASHSRSSRRARIYSRTLGHGYKGSPACCGVEVVDNRGVRGAVGPSAEGREGSYAGVREDRAGLSPERIRGMGVTQLCVQPGKGDNQADGQRLHGDEDVARVDRNERRSERDGKYDRRDQEVAAQSALAPFASRVQCRHPTSANPPNHTGGDQTLERCLTDGERQSQATGKPFGRYGTLPRSRGSEKVANHFDRPAFFDVMHRGPPSCPSTGTRRGRHTSARGNTKSLAP